MQDKVINKIMKEVLRLIIVSISCGAIFIINYFLSLLIFINCGNNLWSFIPAFSTVLAIASLFIYAVLIQISTHRAKRIVQALEKLDLVEFAEFMSDFKERQYQKKELLSYASCIICYEHEAKTITYPCEHKVMCGRCAWKYIATCMQNLQTFTCILCRTEVKDYKGDISIKIDTMDTSDVKKFVRDKVHATTETSIKNNIVFNTSSSLRSTASLTACNS